MREWLTIIIVLLILGILLDGVRRMRAYRKNALRLSKNAADDDLEIGSVSSSEFPSGGARVVAYRDSKDTKDITRSARENYTESRKTKGSPSRTSESSDLNLDVPVPMLMETANEKAKHAGYERTESKHAKADTGKYEDTRMESDFDYDEPSLGSLDDLDDEQLLEAKASVSGLREEDLAPKPYTSPLDDSPSWATEGFDAEDPASSFDDEDDELRDPDMVLVINVMARRGELFSGPDLLDALIASGLRFGDMDIFHRHEFDGGKGKVIFSLANIVMPGTFDISAMGQFETPGVSMFLSLPVSTDSLTAYNLMSDTALALAQQLGGELKDEQRSVMTRQTIEHDKQRVIEYERKKRLERA